MIIAEVDSDVTIHGMINTELMSKLNDSLVWTNPEWIKRQEAGRSTWNCPKNIVLYERMGDKLIVPYGMIKLLHENGVILSPSIHLLSPQRVFYEKIDGLYDYQQKALQCALKSKNGVLVAPCGSGKTQIGLAICAKLGLNTLWLTHTHELLRQSMERAKKYLHVPIGTITGGKINATTGITFATVQTMSKIDLSKFKDFWDIIIVDECHKCVGTPTQITMFWKVLSSLSARYKIGLTATPERGDKMEKAMYALLGEKFFEITREDVKHTTCGLKVMNPIETGWVPDCDKVLNADGTLNYVNLITNCVSNQDRNDVVASVVCSAAEGGPTLVLSERVAHLDFLEQMCNNDYATGNLSTSKKGERKNLLNQLNDGHIRILFATYAIAKEGLDIPCLQNLVLASPIKDKIAVTQSAGRVMRSAPNKEFGTIWEFKDCMPMLDRWLAKRLSIYRRLNDGK